MLISTDLVIGPNTAYAKELCKWEAHWTQYGAPQRPYEYRDYPHRMYKPTRSATTSEVTFEGQTAENEHDRERLERVGFVFGGQGEAMKVLEAREFEIAELAANRALNDRRLSANAQAEAAAVDDTTIRHLPVINEANKKSGRRDV